MGTGDSGGPSGVTEDRLRDRLDIWGLGLGVVELEPRHAPHDPRELGGGISVEFPDNDRNQPVAVVFRSERVLDVALHVGRAGGCRSEQYDHGFGLFQGARDLAGPVLTGEMIAVGIEHFQTAVRKRLAEALGKGFVVVGVAQEDLHGPNKVANAW